MATHFFERDLPAGTIRLYLLRRFTGLGSKVMSRLWTRKTMVLNKSKYLLLLTNETIPTDNPILTYTQADGSIVTVKQEFTISDDASILWVREISKDFEDNTAFYGYYQDLGVQFLSRVDNPRTYYSALRSWNPFDGMAVNPGLSEFFWDNPL